MGQNQTMTTGQIYDALTNSGVEKSFKCCPNAVFSIRMDSDIVTVSAVLTKILTGGFDGVVWWVRDNEADWLQKLAPYGVSFKAIIGVDFNTIQIIFSQA